MTGLVRPAALLLAGTLLSASSCDFDRGKKDPCDGVESEYIPGFDATGFSLGTNGKGYLSTIIRFGDCTGNTEGRLFVVDVNARTAEVVPIDFYPGQILTTPDGGAGIVMGFRDHLGLAGNSPAGVTFLSGSTATFVPLGDVAWDIQQQLDGWLASAGSGGSWRVGFDGIATQLRSESSYCGDDLGATRLICTAGGVAVLDSNDSFTGTVSLPEPATYLVGASGFGVAFHGLDAGVIEGMSLTTSLTVGAVASRAWFSPDANHAFVNGSASSYWVRLDGSGSELLGPDRTDVAFVGSNALLAFSEVVLTNVNLSDGSAELINAYTGYVQQIEPIGPRRFVVVSGRGGSNVEPGYEFEKAFAIYDMDLGWLDTWGLVVE